MPSCKQCEKKFPNILVINGKQRNLQNRRYCLDCSPFGLHNTRNFSYQRKIVGEVQCTRCERFYTYERAKGMSTKVCSACNTTKRRNKLKQRAVDYKGGKCCLCGYNKANSALSFHHLDPEEKDFGIGQSYNKRWEVIKQELDKCALLCQNCHAEVHEGLAQVSLAHD